MRAPGHHFACSADHALYGPVSAYEEIFDLDSYSIRKGIQKKSTTGPNLRSTPNGDSLGEQHAYAKGVKETLKASTIVRYATDGQALVGWDPAEASPPGRQPTRRTLRPDTSHPIL